MLKEITKMREAGRGQNTKRVMDVVLWTVGAT